MGSSGSVLAGALADEAAKPADGSDVVDNPLAEVVRLRALVKEAAAVEPTGKPGDAEAVAVAGTGTGDGTGTHVSDKHPPACMAHVMRFLNDVPNKFLVCASHRRTPHHSHTLLTAARPAQRYHSIPTPFSPY